MSNHSLRGKTALVTGAAKRIGRATALALADAGANIIVHYRSSEEEASELLVELARNEVQCWALQADFEKPDETESLIERAIATARSLDILVNNASIFPLERLEDLTFKSLMTNIQVNAWAPFVLSMQFKRLVGRGKIINLEDSRVTDYDWTHVGYILSKHVLAAFTKYCAVEFAPDIAVNAVAPGLILPPPDKGEEYIDRLRNTVPLKKHGDPENVADMVVCLAKSDFVTGEVIYVDGGRHLKEYTDGQNSK